MMKIQPTTMSFVAGVMCGMSGLFVGMLLLGHGPLTAAGGVSPSAVDMSNLRDDLRVVRSQMELYKVQHLERYPGCTTDGKFDGCLMAQQLTSGTNQAGQISPRLGASDRRTMGPYMPKFPSNPFVTGPNASAVLGGNGPAPRDGKSGWWFDATTGTFSANDTVSEEGL